jgi:hypothetical protein
MEQRVKNGSCALARKKQRSVCFFLELLAPPFLSKRKGGKEPIVKKARNRKPTKRYAKICSHIIGSQKTKPGYSFLLIGTAGILLLKKLFTSLQSAVGNRLVPNPFRYHHSLQEHYSS